VQNAHNNNASPKNEGQIAVDEVSEKQDKISHCRYQFALIPSTLISATLRNKARLGSRNFQHANNF
jgi:riboflavin synthase alpha subunit